MIEKEQIEFIKNWLDVGSINIFGYPFAGKDTQADRLAKMFDAHTISGGQILRNYPDQAEIKPLMATGELFPTDIYLKIVKPYLSKKEFSNKPLLLSSLGRWHGEEPVIVEATEEANHPIKAVIALDLAEAEVWNRLEASLKIHDRGDRLDDNKESLKKRIEEYNSKTLPVFDFYRDKGLLIEVDGSKSRDEVTESILNKLLEFSQKAD